MKASHLSLALTLALASLLAAACGPREGDLCDYKCDCEGCSDREFDDCLYDYDHRYEEADRRGCADLYDELLACEDDTGICDRGDWHTSCKDEREALDRCRR